MLSTGLLHWNRLFDVKKDLHFYFKVHKDNAIPIYAIFMSQLQMKRTVVEETCIHGFMITLMDSFFTTHNGWNILWKCIREKSNEKDMERQAERIMITMTAIPCT